MQLELCRNEVSKTKILYNNLSTVKLLQFLSFSVAARLAFSSTMSTVTLSTLEIVEEEYTVVDTLYLDSGTKEWNLRVPEMVRDCPKRCSRRTCSLL